MEHLRDKLPVIAYVIAAGNLIFMDKNTQVIMLTRNRIKLVLIYLEDFHVAEN